MARKKLRNEPKGERRIKVTADFHNYWNNVAKELNTDSAGVSNILLPKLKRLGKPKLELTFDNGNKKKKGSNHFTI